jgi:hypothetical protein
MAKARLEMPAVLRNLTEKTIDRAEKTFGMLFRSGERARAPRVPSGRSLPSRT